MAFPEYASDTNSLVTPYDPLLMTTPQEIHRLFSTTGEKLHTDDLNSDDDNYNRSNDSTVNRDNFLSELAQRATSHIMTFLAPRYKIDDIYQIPRLREIATYWAVYKLTRRRGNEPVYEEEYIEAMDELEMFRSGERYLDAPSGGQRAYMQSSIVDLRYNRSPIRVIPDGSTKVVSGQHTYNWFGFSWL